MLAKTIARHGFWAKLCLLVVFFEVAPAISGEVFTYNSYIPVVINGKPIGTGSGSYGHDVTTTLRYRNAGWDPLDSNQCALLFYDFAGHFIKSFRLAGLAANANSSVVVGNIGLPFNWEGSGFAYCNQPLDWVVEHHMTDPIAPNSAFVTPEQTPSLVSYLPQFNWDPTLGFTDVAYAQNAGTPPNLSTTIATLKIEVRDRNGNVKATATATAAAFGVAKFDSRILAQSKGLPDLKGSATLTCTWSDGTPCEVAGGVFTLNTNTLQFAGYEGLKTASYQYYVPKALCNQNAGGVIYNSAHNVQNISAALAATFRLTYFPVGGGFSVTPDPPTSIPPGGSFGFTDCSQGVPSPFSGDFYTHTDPYGFVGVDKITSSNNPNALAMNSSPAESADAVAAPWVTRDASGTQDTDLVIMNRGASGYVQVHFYDTNGNLVGGPVPVTVYVPSLNRVTITPASAALSAFNGSAVIYAQKESPDVRVVVNVQIRNGSLFETYRAQPSDREKEEPKKQGWGGCSVTAVSASRVASLAWKYLACNTNVTRSFPVEGEVNDTSCAAVCATAEGAAINTTKEQYHNSVPGENYDTNCLLFTAETRVGDCKN